MPIFGIEIVHAHIRLSPSACTGTWSSGPLARLLSNISSQAVGCAWADASHLSTLISMGARGLDTGLFYDILPMSTDGAQFGHFQESVGTAWSSSGVPRAEFFITNSVPCCPREHTPDGESPTYDVGPLKHCSTRASNITENVMYDLSKLKTGYVDLLLLQWPCNTEEQSKHVTGIVCHGHSM